MIALTAISNAAARDRMVEGFPELPRDAAKVAERSLACIHFGGELSGAGDERDRWVTEQLRKLRCDRVEKDLQLVKHKYRNEPEILKVLAEATYD
ncbi:hypothetical protein [Lysobacter terrae]